MAGDMTLTVREAADLLGTDPRTVTGEFSVNGGTIPALRVGRRIVIPRESFMHWLTGRDAVAHTEPEQKARETASDGPALIGAIFAALLDKASDDDLALVNSALRARTGQ
jgi:excisionase family DNA binding protein